MDDSLEPVVREVIILNREGFHSRPVMRFVDVAQRFDSDIRVTSLKNEDETVDGKSAMELMVLGATKGTTLRIAATGIDAGRAVEALVGLVRNRFGTEA